MSLRPPDQRTVAWTRAGRRSRPASARGGSIAQSRSELERFREIYDANYARLLGYALRRVDSADDAHDVLAETFLAAWRRLDAVPRGPGARLWLYGVARRVLANHRRGGRRRLRLLAGLRSLRPSEGSGLDGGERSARVAEAFGRLSASDRDLLGLVAWEGLSSDELGRVLRCTPGAARIRVHRARKRFAGQLTRLGVDVKRPGETGHVWTDGQPPVPTVEETW